MDQNPDQALPLHCKMILGLPDADPDPSLLIICTDPDPSIIKKKDIKNTTSIV
jgi:hypothetical protein